MSDSTSVLGQESGLRLSDGASGSYPLRELLAAILSGGVVGGQIDPVVVVNQAKANPIQPAGSAHYIPVDRRVGKEVD